MKGSSLTHLGISVLLIAILVSYFMSAIFVQTEANKYVPLSDKVDFRKNYVSLIKEIRQQSLGHMGEWKYFDYFYRSAYTTDAIKNIANTLKTNLYGNPHSESTVSEKSNEVIEEMRTTVLKMFKTSLAKYTTVFVTSAPQGLKLVAEAYPLDENSKLIYSESCDVDLLGFRAIASQERAELYRFKTSEINNETFSVIKENSNNLILLPFVDKFNGQIINEREIEKLVKAQNMGNTTSVLADLSQYGPIDLTKYPLDVVAFSLDKVIGFPSVGIVIIKNDIIRLMDRPYFGGGTLVYALTKKPYEKLRLKPAQRLEDGSPAFLNLVAAAQALDFYSQIGPERAAENARQNAEYLAAGLRRLKYSDGSRMVTFYGESPRAAVAFNVLEKGKVVNTTAVLESANRAGFLLGGGCGSTPGSCHSAMGVEEKIGMEAPKDIGALIASMGWASIHEDADALVEWVNATYYH